MKRKDGLCCRCRIELSGSSGYCAPCERGKNKANYAKRKPVREPKGYYCNCGDKSCNGIRCERASA